VNLTAAAGPGQGLLGWATFPTTGVSQSKYLVLLVLVLLLVLLVLLAIGIVCMHDSTHVPTSKHMGILHAETNTACACLQRRTPSIWMAWL
jgi:hypothetical protein